ncbi:MAG: type II toxin-antitoxin system VapC family toxin [Thermoplasmata archaeon]|nr:type II toxin-antitoxin system VapC family toxin [Thermoplasmata archaeon]MCI4344298.1 type II toxin-antitoxin system VapC family toxin [Thermoplasmata archaeon]
MISIDSYGWIERLSGGPKQAQYNRVFDSVAPSDILTSVVVVYEVYKKAKALLGEHTALESVAALGHTVVVPVDQEIALAAADYSLEHGIHFSDALVYATARRHEAELFTSDEALKGLPAVRFV